MPPPDEETINKFLLETFNKTLKKLKADAICNLASVLEIKVSKTISGSKTKKRNKANLISDIEEKVKTLSNKELIQALKKSNAGIEVEVKNILDNNIDIDAIIALEICLTLEKFFKDNPRLSALFTNKCDLQNINNTIKSTNCMPKEVQGLYILTISKNNIDYIVKLGSFAESQGMYKRITSFGGGNYETGSATNKWFQKFIKKAIEKGYTSKFTYYNSAQPKILVENLDGEKKEITPYIIRPLETELFKKYNTTNNNIPPIFGSNCL